MRRSSVALLAGALVVAGCGPFPPALGGRAATPQAPAPADQRPGAPGGARRTGVRAPATLASSPADTAPSALAVAEATHEYPSRSVREHVAAAAPDAPTAVRTFAEAYINWSAATVGADMRALAAASVGQARSAMALAAAQTSADGELRRGGIANHGSVATVSPLAGQRGRYVVVTEETTTATNTTAYAGLGAAWHVTVATVMSVTGGGWVVSGWQPES